MVDPFDQLYKKGVVPFETLMLTPPFDKPKHEALVTIELKVGPLPAVITVFQAYGHPLASKIFIEIAPADNPETSSVVAPFDQKKKYGELPPEIVMSTAPLFKPPQLAFVTVDAKFIGTG